MKKSDQRFRITEQQANLEEIQRIREKLNSLVKFELYRRILFFRSIIESL